MASRYDDEYDDDFDQDEENGPAQLRKALAKANKRLKELETENGQLKSAQKETSLTGILTAKGVNPKVIKYLKADDVEANEEAVSKWLDENADVFNINIKKDEPKGESDGDGEQKATRQEQDPEVAATLAAIAHTQEVESSGGGSLDGGTDIGTLLSRMGERDDLSFDDAMKALKELGAPGLVEG